MEQRIWYFKNGTVTQPYDIIYDDGKYICVRSVNSGKYSYGMSNNFGTLYGFPVGQSCLPKEEIIKTLSDNLERSQKHWGKTVPDSVFKEWKAKSEMIKRLQPIKLAWENRTEC